MKKGKRENGGLGAGPQKCGELPSVSDFGPELYRETPSDTKENPLIRICTSHRIDAVLQPQFQLSKITETTMAIKSTRKQRLRYMLRSEG